MEGQNYGVAQLPPLRDVAGKVAYVSGASSGIGLGCARVLREAGMKVVIGYVDERQLDEAMGHFRAGDPDVHAIRHDVSDAAAWERVADEIDTRFGRTHLLVNNAGVGLQAAAATGTLKDWQWAIGVNLWGAIYGIHTFIPRMKAHGEGAHIVTVSSMSGALPGAGAGIYTVTKAALAALMEELRVELQDTNIGTTVVFPGFVQSNILAAESYRPDALKNEPAPGAAGAAPAVAAGYTHLKTAMASQMDALEMGRWILDGIRHNDLFVFSHPEWKAGVKMRAEAILASFLDRPVPPARVPPNPLRSTVYVREVAHRLETNDRPFGKD